MKWLTIVFLLLAIAPAGHAKEIQIDGGAITFAAPPGFTALSRSEIATKFPKARAPRFVIGNAARTTTIAYDLKPHTVADAQLEAMMAGFVRSFEQAVKGIVWKKRAVVERVGKRWVHLEFTSEAVDTDIHNIMLVTPHSKELLILNFNSTRGEFPSVEKALRRSIASIRVRK